jgi:murein DD-endopeptidase MepM/ murein hydrolase activator NlpD
MLSAVKPLIRAAVAATALSAAVRAAQLAESPAAGDQSTARPPQAWGELGSLCPAGTLPDGMVCIPVPSTRPGSAAILHAHRGMHRRKDGLWYTYDHIPRRPDRPAEYAQYRLPVSLDAGGVGSGYDLDLPDALQRRGPGLSAVGHGGIDIAHERGTEVRLVNLEHQVGAAEVVHVGDLFGTSVVTRHSVRQAGELRSYLTIYGHLEMAAPGLSAGTSLDDGGLVGFVGDSGSPGIVHLHLEIRRVRRGVDLDQLAPRQLVENAKTVACDPRNALPLLGR